MLETTSANIISGKVVMNGEHTGMPHVVCGDMEVIVHDAPELKVGDVVVVEFNRKLELAKNAMAVYATEVAVEPKPDPNRYYTDEDVRMMTAAHETMVACGIDEDDAWELSYEIIVLDSVEEVRGLAIQY